MGTHATGQGAGGAGGTNIQREAATLMGLNMGMDVSIHLRRLQQALSQEVSLIRHMTEIDSSLVNLFFKG